MQGLVDSAGNESAKKYLQAAASSASFCGLTSSRRVGSESDELAAGHTNTRAVIEYSAAQRTQNASIQPQAWELAAAEVDAGLLEAERRGRGRSRSGEGGGEVGGDVSGAGGAGAAGYAEATAEAAADVGSSMWRKLLQASAAASAAATSVRP
jgi:hypothetical protein